MSDNKNVVLIDANMEKIKDAVIAMEHASFYGLHDRLQELTQQNIDSKCPLLQEWSRIYQLFYRRNALKITAEKLIKAIQYQSSDDSEMFIAYRLLHAYGSYDLRDFGVLNNVIKALENEINKIRDSNLEPFYRFRLSQLLANIYLKKNEVDQARQQANFIINHCPNHSYVASAYQTLGLSYLYEDYGKGISAIEQSLQIYLNLNFKVHAVNVNRTKIFYNNYWGVDGKHIIFSNKGTDIKERAHFEVRRGNKEKALDILSRIDYDSLDSFELGFYFFYKGLTLDSVDLLYKSIEAFKKIQDKFTAHMVRIELYRLGEREATVEAAYN
jgi:tetratricopeptide (TPR) repeat protein